MTATFLEELKNDGLDIPNGTSLDDEQLHDKLWDLVKALHKKQICLTHTDHLSDRELYEKLLTDVLSDDTDDVPEGPGWWTEVDISDGSTGSEDGLRTYYQYYADEMERDDWLAQWPNFKMPPSVKRPYDRDKLLPKAPFGM